MKRQANIRYAALLGAGAFLGLIGGTVFPVVPAFAEGTTLVEGIGDQWQSLDPQYSSASKDAQILGDLYEGLVGLDAAGKPAPGAAESWDISPDGLTYTFHLRAGLKWSNGDPLTAQDFVNGVERQLNPDTASYKAYYLFTQLPITGAGDYNAKQNTDFSAVAFKATDDRTILMHLDRPNPYALQLLNYYYISPLHAPSWKAYGADFVSAEHFVGNGAYMLKELAPNSHALLVKNPNYWDAANVKVEAINYAVTEDVNTEFKQFQAGQIDITWDIPTDRMEEIKKQYGAQLHIAPYAGTDYISFNTQKAPLSDIRIREALALAIDRDVVVNKVAKSGERIISSFVPPLDPSYPSLKPKDFTDDQKAKEALARKLMAEAGYGPGKPLTISYYCTADDLHKKETEAISIMWQTKLGVVSRIKLEDSDTLYADFSKLEWDAYCDGLVGDYAGAEPFLVYRTEAAGAGYPWKNDAFEAAMAKATEENDLAKRKEILAQAEQALLDDYPLAPLLQESKRNLIAARVTGWVDNPIGYHLTKFLELQ
jgi:ABC-type oligopeptide transport system substrate-binding subunit